MSFIKVYFGDKPLWITDEVVPQNEGILTLTNTDVDIKKAMASSANEAVWMKVHNIEEAKAKLFAHFHTAIAGGGLVRNKRGEFLLIYRRDRWDLPKGHLDEGETIEACALREVREETGLTQLDIVTPIMVTYHTYVYDNQEILKETHWFLMNEKMNEQLVAQTEEDIQRIEWVKRSELNKYYDEMFPLIRDVLDQHFLMG